MECLGLHNKPKAEVHPGHELTGPEQEEAGGSGCGGTVHPRIDHEGLEGEQKYSYILSLTSALNGGEWSMPCSGHFTPKET
jgi:hypothetical protein